MKRKPYFKLISLLVAISMLAGCSLFNSSSNNDKNIFAELGYWVPEKPTTPTEEPTTGENPVVEQPIDNDSMYGFSLYDDTREYTEDEIKEQAVFDKYLTDCFIDSMESCYLNLVYNVEDPEAMGINCDVITWGDASLESMEDYPESLQSDYDELLEFDYNSLDYEGQLIYDTLVESYEDELVVADYWYFAESFSPLDGIQTNIPILLAEIEFADIDDIDNYLALLNDTRRYIGELLDLETYRSEKYGLFISDIGAEDVINQCTEFIDSDAELLLTTFDERIEAFSGLTAEQKTEYKSQNKKAVNEIILPSFEDMVSTLTKLKGTRLHDSLTEYEGGSEYYAYITKGNTGSSLSVSELSILTDQYIETATNTISDIAQNDIMAIYDFYDPEYPVTDPKETLDYFIDKLNIDFPAVITSQYQVKYVPDALEASSSPAFYILAPIDNVNKNIIYLNGSEEYADTDIYPILAHEGYPGHLYQTTYFFSLNPHPFRSVLSFIGYTEGWAMYSERYSYDYSGLSENCIELLKANDLYGYGLYSKVDFGVNYSGWTLADTEDFLADEGLDINAAKELYYIAVDDPCVYHRYFLGMVQMLEAQNEAKNLLGNNYSNKNFNKFMLEIGPTYFDIISDRMKEWSTLVINEN